MEEKRYEVLDLSAAEIMALRYTVIQAQVGGKDAEKRTFGVLYANLLKKIPDPVVEYKESL